MAITDKRLDQAQLKKFLSYDPETGVFIRVATSSLKTRRHIGEIAGYITSNGYWVIAIEHKRNRFRAHRLAWLFMTGKWPENDIDHINGDRLDNRWINLREATRSQNLGNSRIPSTNKSGFKGVSFDHVRGKWKAQITLDGVHYFLGRYDEIEDAIQAYRSALGGHFGKFARFE